MAKSARSKWKRKMRQLRLPRYRAKELIQLKGILANAVKEPEELKNVATVLSPGDVKKRLQRRNRNKGKNISENENTPICDTDLNEEPVKRKQKKRKKSNSANKPFFSVRDAEDSDNEEKLLSLLNKKGKLPVWLNQRKLKKLSRKKCNADGHQILKWKPMRYRGKKKCPRLPRVRNFDVPDLE